MSRASGNRTHWTRRDDLPQGIVDLAKRRTAFLFDVMRSMPETPVGSVLASAYLMGIEDAVVTLEHNPELVGASSMTYFGA